MILIIDAFTDRPFAGNPAAVCILTGPKPETWMQEIAEEMNLSETAFLYPEGPQFNLRWFTPVAEVDLCGHATLASAHALWEEKIVEPNKPIAFQTKSGRLKASKTSDGIELDFPATPVTPEKAPPHLLEALSVKPKFIGKSKFDFLLELESDAEVRNLTPDFSRLKEIPVRGILVTAKSSNPQYDFISRCFFPQVGVNEDPVTGSAHCALAPYWANRLGKENLKAYQASSRGGKLDLRLSKDRVFLIGKAVTVLKGELVSES